MDWRALIIGQIILCSYFKLAIQGGKVVEVYKVFGHVCGQDQVYDSLAHQFVRVPVQVLEDVDSVVRGGELEAQGRMVVLQHSDVVVQLGQVTVRIAQEGTAEKKHNQAE